MMKFKEIVILLAAMVFLPFILAQPPATWKLDYSLYRLIYSFTLDNNATDVYVNVVIPTDVIDNYLQMLQSKGINISLYPEALIPRVYYYNETLNEEVQVDFRNIIWISTYNGFYNNFSIYFNNLPAGTHYIIIYLPYYFVEDFEDDILRCVGDPYVGKLVDGWYISKLYSHCAEGWCSIVCIEGNGFDPTPIKKMKLIAMDGSAAVKRTLNIKVDPIHPLIFSADVFGSGSIIFVFVKKDGSQIAIAYKFGDTYYNPGLPVCYVRKVSTGRVTIDILKDLSSYCYILTSDIQKLSDIYITTISKSLDISKTIYIDNIKIISSAYLS